MSTIQLKVRIPARRVRAVRSILESAGTDTGGIINMLFAKIENTNAVPFAMFDTHLDGPEYVRREYGASPEKLERATKKAAAEIRLLKKQGKLIRVD